MWHCPQQKPHRPIWQAKGYSQWQGLTAPPPTPLERMTGLCVHGRSRGKGLWIGAVILAWLLGGWLGTPFSLWGGDAFGAPHAFERQKIEAQALASFQAVVRLWAEEDYFALYERGLSKSRNALEREEFVRRMVRLKHVPQWPLNPAQIRTKLHFRGVVYVTATVVYRTKQAQQKPVLRRQTFLLMREDAQWRIDLLRVVRGIFY